MCSANARPHRACNRHSVLPETAALVHPKRGCADAWWDRTRTTDPAGRSSLYAPTARNGTRRYPFSGLPPDVLNTNPQPFPGLCVKDAAVSSRLQSGRQPERNTMVRDCFVIIARKRVRALATTLPKRNSISSVYVPKLSSRLKARALFCTVGPDNVYHH